MLSWSEDQNCSTFIHCVYIFWKDLNDIPGSESSPGGGCAESGPGVLCDPGDLTSSFIGPP